MNTIKVKYLVNRTDANSSVIKNQAYTAYKEGLYPAYSASGQDIWLEDYTYDEPGIVVSAVGARCGKTFIAEGKWGICANTQVLFLNLEKCDLKYINYILNDENWWIKGGTAQPFVKIKESLNKEIWYPSVEKQKIIANYLDKKCTEIDALIFNIKTQIKKLQEYKKSVITNKMYNDEYQFIKLKHIGSFQNGINFSNNLSEHKIPFLGVANFQNKMILKSKDEFSEISINEILPDSSKLRNNDIIFVRSNGSKQLVGRSVLVQNIDYDITYSGFCIRFRIENTNYNPKFVIFALNSDKFRNYLDGFTQGTNISNVSQNILKNFLIPSFLPQKQKEIIIELEDIFRNLDLLINLKEKQLSKLDEYKKSLIYECVTGKKEVK